jgi:hypothetical protein
LSTNVTPLGSAPVSLRFGVGVPVVNTENVPATPTANDVLLALVIAGAWSTVSVKACVAGVPTPLLAVKVSGYVPPVPAAGVPINVAVPFALATNVTPLGSTPASVMDGAGAPVVVTVKVPAPPTVNVVLLALVIVGAVCAAFTVKVKVWVAAVPTPLLAVKVSGYVPEVPDAGVPLSVAVPFALEVNVTPLGSVPVFVTEGIGVPVVVTVKVPFVPTENVVLLALVMLGAVETSSPNTLNSLASPTYTFPFATVGTANLIAPPGLSRVRFSFEL